MKFTESIKFTKLAEFIESIKFTKLAEFTEKLGTMTVRTLF